MVKAIIEDLNKDYFGIFIDESKDVFHKKQMTLVLRYVNKEGKLIERFLGLVHGQCYDRASNMQGEINGLKTLILKDNSSAYYIHCFAHQLQLTLVVVAKKHDDKYGLEKLKRKISSVTYSHYLRVEFFYAVIDLQLSKLNNRFSEVNTDLLLGMTSLSPENYFTNYDKDKIMKLATYYPNDFSASKLEDLSFDLDNYIYYVREVNNAFSNLKGLGDHSIKLVETNMHKIWGLVYFLVKSILILPVATATMERTFSSMKFIKNDFRSRIVMIF
ncbi:uncharacterized protein LOC107844157 [Capsicum annuum]|uniref:uncharacterized protein LOC107844157 n=1 Tax=Capsicum annuum TaxID=4072 RepID=UPI001FB0CAB1|nr:uncharacterized protein LOC107844157 [Capsicum annuum]